MKPYAALIIIVILFMGALVGCGEDKAASTDNGKAEIAMIVGESGIDDQSFNQTTWEKIQNFADTTDKTCAYYISKKSAKEAYLKLIDKAVKKGAKLIVLSGSDFATTVFEAQKTYTEIKFMLIDGIPHDDNENYFTGNNTVAVIFAEEEAGFLAGYAVVSDGSKNIGFMGGQEIPPVKRYGFGFVQGAAFAASQLEKKINLRYIYTGTFEASKDIRKQAEAWYKDGTDIIFACGGSMGKSVMKAAEKANGKIVGVDVDQSQSSETVVTSAKKSIGHAVERVLKEYLNDSFAGGKTFNYSARNKGVAIELEDARFNRFNKQKYNNILKQIKKDEIQIKKDTDVNALTEITGDWITVIK